MIQNQILDAVLAAITGTGSFATVERGLKDGADAADVPVAYIYNATEPRERLAFGQDVAALGFSVALWSDTTQAAALDLADGVVTAVLADAGLLALVSEIAVADMAESNFDGHTRRVVVLLFESERIE